MKVLVVKTSSLGDLIHTLPALTDAARAIPNIQFDWIAEEAFKELPTWHSAVRQVIPIAWRRWRKRPFLRQHLQEWSQFKRMLRATDYDRIIDAQGLLKSAFFSRLARGERHGLSWRSAREPLVACFYNVRHRVAKSQHAVLRLRQLFAQALDYTVDDFATVDYGIELRQFSKPVNEQRYIVFLHGTTWSTKHWPEAYWIDLVKRVGDTGFHVYLPWGNPLERARAEHISAGQPHAVVLTERLSLRHMAGLLAGASAVVAVDTGLGHLAAALNRPTINIYGPTNPELTGTVGLHQKHISAQFACAPCLQERCHYRGARTVEPACFESISPEKVWIHLNHWLMRNSV